LEHLVVGLGVEQLGEVPGVLDPLQEGVPAADLVAEAAGVLGQLAGAAGVVPELRVTDLARQPLQAGALAGKVKDAPGAG
jgi:hypothetical protein